MTGSDIEAFIGAATELFSEQAKPGVVENSREPEFSEDAHNGPRFEVELRLRVVDELGTCGRVLFHGAIEEDVATFVLEFERNCDQLGKPLNNIVSPFW